jgi:hypothetical protein
MANEKNIRYEDFSEDVDLWCRLSDLGQQQKYFLTVPESLFYYRKESSSLSSSNIQLMQLKMRWIKDCLIRRRGGDKERSLSDFISSMTPLKRLINYKRDLATEFYRSAGFCAFDKKYLRCVFYAGLCALLSPSLVYKKLRSIF